MGVVIGVEIVGQVAQVVGELVWLLGERRRLHHLGIAGEILQQRQLVLLGEALEVGHTLAGFHVDALLRRLTQHRADPRMGVLDVIDGVVAGLGLGQVQVEVEVLLAAAHHVEEARRILAHLLAQLAQGDELAGAGGHLQLFAAAVEDGELHQQHVQLVGIVTQSLERRLHPRHVAVVIGTPDIDDPLETAFEFVHVIGDVGGEVGGLAVLALDHPVLLVTELGGPEPERTILLVEPAALAQPLDGPVHRARFHQRTLGEPLVVDHAKLLQVVADVVEDGVERQLEDVAVAVVAQQLARPGDEGVDVLLLVATVGLVGRHAVEDLVGAVAVVVAMLAVQSGGDVPDVVTLVAVARKGQLLARQLQVAQPHRGGENVHLAPGVVDVVFAVHVEAHRFEQIGHHGTVGRTAPVAHVQGTGGIGGDELHLHPLALPQVGAAIVVRLLQDPGHHGVVGVGGKMEVDEAGAGDLHLLHLPAVRQGFDDLLRQVARPHARRLAVHQRGIGGEVAVGRIPGSLHGRTGHQRGIQQALLHQALQCGRDELFDLRFHHRSVSR